MLSHPRNGPRRALLPCALALFASVGSVPALTRAPLAAAGPQGVSQEVADPRAAGSPAPSSEEVSLDVQLFAAEGLNTTLSWAEFDAVILNRHALTESGRAALKHLTETKLLEVLAREQGIEVPKRQVEQRLEEIDRSIKASGESSGLIAHLRERRLSSDIFYHFMRLAIVHEILTRRALGIPDDAAVTGEQQTMWLDEVLAERGYQTLPPPWKDGIVARSGDVVVQRAEYVAHLRSQLDEEEIREACYQSLLVKRMRARMPDLAPAALERALEAEIERRRRKAESDPRYQGLTFEALLGAQGLNLHALSEDPAVKIAALTKLWVDRRYSAEDLRQLYQSERELFDGLYGEAVETRVLFLRGATFKNELNPRSFEQAEAELTALRASITSLSDFVKQVEGRSEDKKTRGEEGLMGWVTRGDTRAPRKLREAVFEALDSGRLPRDGAAKGADQQLLGPLRLTNGSVMLWLGQRRPAPPWERMVHNVHVELRKRFIDEVLPAGRVLTFLDLD